MKKIVKRMTLLTLALALLLTQVAFAEQDAAIQGVFEALVAEDSEYSQNKAMSVEYFPGTEYEETLNENGFTLAISGNEYMNGSWTFTRDGDYLTFTTRSDDFSGMALTIYVLRAVASYLGMNPTLANTYANGVTTLNLENENIISTVDEEAGTATLRIKIDSAWDMKELDTMKFDEQSLMFEPLSEQQLSMGGSIGKMIMVANGTADDATILMGEYGGMDDLAFESMINTAKVLQPKNWEDFVQNYTELKDAEGAGWSVTLNVSMEQVAEIIEDGKPEYTYAIIRFAE